jgi:autophagy-related protein 16|mmetsp:Transcript_12289/g.56887  ORF Transcript_12289/g.56887 Transcript_12289/m.56887 type:complete len:570 (+) Transcript_12289:2212-3921(+)
MDTSPSGDSAATLLAKLQARNRVEVDAFKAVFEAHAGAQRQARVLQERVAMLNRRCAELSENEEKMEADLKVANEAAAKGTAVKDQSARISELQTELAASYKQHAESSQQVIAAKEQQAKAEQELVTAKDALAVAERERDEARERGSELEAALEESRTAAAAATSEAEARLSARNEAVAKAEAMEAENASLVERLMQLKMAEAEKMNEINDLYDNLQRQKKSAEMRAMASDLSAASAESMSSLTGAVGGANAFGSGYFPARKRLAIRANVGGTHRVAFTPGGDVLATAGDDRTVALFDAGSGNPTGPERLTGSTGAMLDVDFSGGDGGGAGSVLMVLGAGTDRAVRLWDATTGRTRHTLTGHAEKVVSAKFCPWNYARAVSCSHDRTIKVWDLERGFCKASIMCASNCNSVTYGESAAVVISGHYDGAARIWDLRQKPGAACEPVEVRGHSQHVTAVTMMPTNRSQFITSSRDNTLKLVDLRSGRGDVVRTLKASGYRSGTQWANPCVAPDGRHVVAGGADGGVFVWNVNDGGLKVTLRGHDVAVATCAWSQSGLVTADKNGVAIVWSG